MDILVHIYIVKYTSLDYKYADVHKKVTNDFLQFH